MRKSNETRKKRFLALCLSAMMMASVGALAACSEEETDSSSPSSSSVATSEVIDNGIIKNAGFETASESKLAPITTSVTGWTRSVNSTSSGTALASKAASGILDLDVDAWETLTSSKLETLGLDLAKADEETVKNAWKDLTVRDKLAYYEIWEKANESKDIKKDLSFYEDFNVKSADIPQIDWFSTHYASDDTENKDNTKVLMLHNQYPETGSSSTYKALGTAQKFTSSSTVTVPAGTSVQFSVWVKTLDLQTSATDGSIQTAVDRGAYISLTPSIGGTSVEEYRVENINTELMDKSTLSNGWKQYSFYLKGSSYSTTTFSLVLGLGQGGGTDRYEYVNGYAFFDDIECKVIENNAFESAVKTETDGGAIGAFETEKENKVFDVAKGDNVAKDAFAIDFYGDFTANANVLSNVTTTATATETADGKVTSLATQNPAKWLSGGFDGTNDVNKTFADLATLKSAAETANNPYLSKVYADHFEGNAYLNAINDANATNVDKQILLLLSANGVAYTAESSYEFTFNKDVEYMAISFFVKTSDLNGYTGAGITLVDGNNKTSFTALDTTSVIPVETDTNEDLYAGWQQCFFFVRNASQKETATFKLVFNFGHTSIEESNSKDSYHAGFAAFTNFQVLELDKPGYDRAASGTYSKVVSVKAGNEDDKASGVGFDTEASVPSSAIKEGLANAQNFKGVYADSQYVNPNGTTTVVNTHENAGLLSKEYFTAEDGYYATATGAWMDGIKAIASKNTAVDVNNASAVWNEVFGKGTTQPYVIWNDSANANKAYGLIGKSTQISANTCTPISLRVKVGNTDGEDAVANIYLVNTDDDSYQSNLSIGTKTIFWYDDDGNLCTGDPKEKATKIAFRLQSNGLYKANKNWEGYAKLENKDAYYANLGAYAKDADNNLIVAKSGASHDYSDYWNNEGVDGIAYYYKDGKYYADRDKTVEVLDVASTTLPVRYQAQSNRELVATVGNTNGAWKTITFYIQTGELAKNYRLEVWSGVRNGEGNKVNSYVFVDQNNPSTDDVSKTFTNLIAEYKDVDGVDKFESIFSYFDTDNYLRYNANLDEKGYGNLYKDNYVASEQTSGVAYLKYDDADDLIVLADYSYSEKTVTASEPDLDDDDDSSSDEAVEETNVWLLASSLAIAAILIFVVISLAVRKIIKNSRKKRGIR